MTWEVTMSNLPKWGIWNPYYVLFAEQVASDNFEPIEMALNSGTIVCVDQNPIMMQKNSSFSKEPQIVLIECPDGFSRLLTTSPLMPVIFAKRVPVSVNTIGNYKRRRIKKITPIFVKGEQDQD